MKEVRNKFKCPDCGSEETTLSFSEHIKGDDRQEIKCRDCGYNSVTIPPYTNAHAEQQGSNRTSRISTKPLTQRLEKVA